LACAPPDPGIIFRLLAETAWSMLGCSGAIASQPTSDAIFVRGVAGETPLGLGSKISLDGTLTGVALRTGTSQICDDWLQDPRTGVTPVTAPLSFVVVPLVYEGEVIALLGAHASRVGAFDEQDLELLAMLGEVGANRLAHALTLHSHDELQAQSSAVLTAMTAGLTVLDTEGRIRFANPAALAVFRLTPEEMTGLSNRDDFRWQAVHEDGSPWPGDTHPSAVALRTGVPQRDQIMGVDNPKGGGLCWLAVNAIPIHDAAGAVTGGGDTAQDRAHAA